MVTLKWYSEFVMQPKGCEQVKIRENLKSTQNFCL